MQCVKITLLSLFILSFFPTILPERKCGYAIHPTPFIVNGGNAGKNQWPWVVSIFIKNNKGYPRFIFHCTGVLIEKRLVLTTAHCCHRPPTNKGIWPTVSPHELIVRTGEHRINTYDFGERRLKVSKIFQHHLWPNDPTNYSHDIAILKLKLRKRHTHDENRARPVCIPQRNFKPANDSWSCFVVGWGRTSTNSDEESLDSEPPVSDTDNMLKQAQIPVWSQDKCEEAWRPGEIDKSMLCAGIPYSWNKTRAIGPCSGDSGGPMLCSEDLTKWYVMGLVSWGTEPCLFQYPAVFANVTDNVGFIRWVARKNRIRTI